MSAADRVVDEITAFGGSAVSNHDSVATSDGGQAIVQAALDAFGRVDVLVNHAGIVRVRAFPKTIICGLVSLGSLPPTRAS